MYTKTIRKSHLQTWLLLIILFLIICAKPTLSAVVTLEITVSTDKHRYGLNENVYINGTLKWQPYNISVNTVIGIEIRDPANLPFAFRTRPSGTITSENWLVNYTQLFSCDSNGYPKYSFKRGNNLYIFFEIKNFDTISSHAVIACITLFDANMVPIGSWYPLTTTLEPGASKSVLFFADKIPSSAALGTATLYANAYTDFPKNGGYPYCPERTATFTITSSTSSSTSNLIQYAETFDAGTYELSLRLPKTDARIGNYTVYASAYSEGQIATTNKTFEVVLIGDINGDKVVDIFDAILMSIAYGSHNGDPKWNPNADLDNSGEIDIFDAIILSAHYGEEAL
ncbi:MAG: hypothetical protein QXX51_00670 [Candidatus Bathyarchaeia archaeon]